MSWVSEYVPEVVLVIVLLAVGLAISIIGFTAYTGLQRAIYRMGIVWSMPVRYGQGWLVEVSLVYPNPINPPLRPGYPHGYAWGWGVRKSIPFLTMRQLKFMTSTGIQPGYALQCGNYTISSIRAYYCIFYVKAYPIMPLITR